MAFHFSAFALALAALLQAAPAEMAWSPPIQADWKTSSATPFNITLINIDKPVHFSQGFKAQLRIVSTNGSAINDGAGLGRGVFIEVRDQHNRLVAPQTAMNIPPPLPPLENKLLVRPSPQSPLIINLTAPVDTIFPKNGKYTIRAKLRSISLTEPLLYRISTSNLVYIDVVN